MTKRRRLGAFAHPQTEPLERHGVVGHRLGGLGALSRSSPLRRRHAAAFSASRAAFQFQTSSSSNRLFFVAPDTMRSRMSVRYVSGSTPCNLQVLRSDARIAQVSPPPSLPQNRLFFFPMDMCRIERSTMFVSGSSLPSSRNL